MPGCLPQTPVPPSISLPTPHQHVGKQPREQRALAARLRILRCSVSWATQLSLLSPSPRGSHPHCFLSFSALLFLPPQASLLSTPSDSPRNFPDFSFPTAHLPSSCRHPASPTRPIVAAPTPSFPPCSRIASSFVPRWRAGPLFSTGRGFQQKPFRRSEWGDSFGFSSALGPLSPQPAGPLPALPG